MKVQFFGLMHSSVHYGDENLGISRITSFLRERGVSVDLKYIHYDKDVNLEYNKIDLGCDLFGFSVYGAYTNYVFEIAKRIKKEKPNALICLGSKFVTDASDLIIDDCEDVDFVVLGHGEFPLYDVIQGLIKNESIEEIAARNKHIKTRKNRAQKEICNTDINLLPWPDREYLKSSNRYYANIVSSHGCTASCSFCSVTREKMKWSGRSVDDIMNEIIDIYNTTGIRWFVFSDGTFDDPGKLGKERVRELCLRLKEYPIKFAFRCYTRAESFKDNEKDRELLKLMKETGFTVFIGIEAGNNEDLLVYNKRATMEDNERALALFNSYGIEPLYGFIFINPYSDESRVERNFKFLISHKSYHLDHYFKCLQVFHNTPIYHKLKSDNLLREDYSYKESFYAYKVTDQYAGEVFKFLREFFHGTSKLGLLDIRCHNFIHFYSYMEALLDDISDIQNSVNEIKNELFNQCKEYFTPIYMEKDIEQCRRQYKNFEKKMEDIYSKVDVVKLKLFKKYFKINCEKNNEHQMAMLERTF